MIITPYFISKKDWVMIPADVVRTSAGRYFANLEHFITPFGLVLNTEPLYVEFFRSMTDVTQLTDSKYFTEVTGYTKAYGRDSIRFNLIDWDGVLWDCITGYKPDGTAFAVKYRVPITQGWSVHPFPFNGDDNYVGVTNSFAMAVNSMLPPNASITDVREKAEKVFIGTLNKVISVQLSTMKELRPENYLIFPVRKLVVPKPKKVSKSGESNGKSSN